MSDSVNTEVVSFHAGRWNDLCVRLAAEASRNCGLVHDIYQRLFSEAVDLRLKEIPEAHHPAALEIAYRWDYLDAQGRAQVDQDNADQGYCSHGLDPNCCPRGCGDLPWFNTDEET